MNKARVLEIGKALEPVLPPVLADIVAKYDSLPRPPHRWGELSPLAANDPRLVSLKKFLSGKEGVTAQGIEKFLATFNGAELDPEAFHELGTWLEVDDLRKLRDIGFDFRFVRVCRSGWRVWGFPREAAECLPSVEVLRIEIDDALTRKVPKPFDPYVGSLEEVQIRRTRSAIVELSHFPPGIHVHCDLDDMHSIRTWDIPTVHRSIFEPAELIESVLVTQRWSRPDGFRSVIDHALRCMRAVPNLRKPVSLTEQGPWVEAMELADADFGEAVCSALSRLRPRESIAFLVEGVGALMLSRDPPERPVAGPRRFAPPFAVELEAMSAEGGANIYAPMSHPAQMRGVRLSTWLSAAPATPVIATIRLFPQNAGR